MSATVKLDALPDPTKAIGAECRKCGHVWIVVYLPMDMADVAKVGKHAACPKCADAKPRVAKTAQVAELLKALP